jgi:hypothetical protein
MAELPLIPESFTDESFESVHPKPLETGDYDARAMMVDEHGHGWLDHLARPVNAVLYQQSRMPSIHVKVTGDTCGVSISKTLLYGHRWVKRTDIVPNNELWQPVTKFLEADEGREGEPVPEDLLESLKDIRFEKWPGFVQLKRRLETFTGLLRLNSTGRAFLEIDLIPGKPGPIYRLTGKDVDLVLPANEREFEASSYRARLAFTAGGDITKKVLNELVPEEFTKRPLHRVTLWAYSGSSNQITCVYNCQILNEGTTQVYLEYLGDDRYELGFEASGNLFDSLLVADVMLV